MATVLDSVDITGKRTVHFEQILSYLENVEEENWYYGNKEQFEKRHLEIKEWLKTIIEKSKDTNYIIPKLITTKKFSSL